MADQKRWFKVWTSLLVDMDNLPNEVIGVWTRLGCRAALVGDRGVLRFDSWGHLARFLNVHPEDAQTVAMKLRNVSVEEGKNRHGEVLVTFKNWTKYQEDSTQAERARASRAKRRGEEKRGEETRREQKQPLPVVPLPEGFEAFWGAYPKKVGKGEARKSWQRLHAEARSPEILAALARQQAYLARDGGQYIPLPATWLNQRRWEDSPPDPGRPGDEKTRQHTAGIRSWLDAQPTEGP